MSLGKSLDLEVDDGDIKKLVDKNKEEMTTEERLLLQEHQYTNAMEKIKEPEIEESYRRCSVQLILKKCLQCGKKCNTMSKNTTHKN